MISKLQRVPLREVWQHEARDFTTWLQDNIDVLNDALDLTLSNPEREQAAGKFSVDIIAEDESGNPVIIENQLEKSDHDHLGKIITYLTTLDARMAIWIVGDPRPEHINAISWLNESSSAAFYLLKLEGVRIGDSPPAPLLTLIVGPSEEARRVGETKKELAEQQLIRRRFWTALLEKAKTRTRLHTGISPGRDTWIGTGAGKSGLGFNYVIGKHASGDENKRVFNALLSSRAEIETAFGEGLEWEALEGRQACRIARRYEGGGYSDEEKWEAIHETMIDAMVRLEQALSPYISELPV